MSLYIPYFIEFLQQTCKVSIISSTLQIRNLKLNKRLSNHCTVKKKKSSKSSLSDSRPVLLITILYGSITSLPPCHLINEHLLEDRRLGFWPISLMIIFMHLEWNIRAIPPPLTLFFLWKFLLRGLDSSDNC